MHRRIMVVAIVGAALVQSAQAAPRMITVEQVIREACTNSDSAKLMKETGVKSAEMIRERRSGALPAVSTSVSAARQYSPSVFPPPYAQPVPSSGASCYRASIQASQPLYTFGKVSTAIRIAAEFDSSVRQSTGRGNQQLQLLALDAFYRVVLSEMALTVAERSRARKQELSEFLNRNFRLGAGSKAQILATEADLESQASEIIEARQDLMSARMGLNALIGRPLTDAIQPDTASAGRGLLSMTMPSEQEALQTALAQRGDLRALGFLAEVNDGGARILDAMYLPSIGATASLAAGGSEPRDLTDWSTREWMVGVGLQWTLFDGFANNARARQYRSDARKLRIAHDAVTKMIGIEVRTALAECSAADSAAIAARGMLAAAQESYDLTNANFKQGSGQFADLQDAQQRLRQAEMGSVGAQYRLVRSRAALLVSMGNNIIN